MQLVDNDTVCRRTTCDDTLGSYLFSTRVSAISYLVWCLYFNVGLLSAIPTNRLNQFLRRLTELFATTRSSIWLTHKRLSYDDDEANVKALKSGVEQLDLSSSATDNEGSYPCLLRVTEGGEIKFSTRIAPAELDRFYDAYSALLKTAMTAESGPGVPLRKRDKKRDKQRAEEAARRKKKILTPVIIDGPKRGAGRRRRQRQVKAALRQQEAQRKFKEREEVRAKQQQGRGST
ncbi:hypothetical protein FISHEDRAFT_40032 [Fistulina hepatica ATCC 64428]|uniref:Signal recognition particle subunit SRP14 n=1 Tax=Fistulina hepatica ATCC 64428 TaxID=1128425 RepID=A0A0D7AF84_9AGAR|nr:hypothetical protein FISHEDRAFT_40032 [Fistulina hepatica ATCC 64428]